LFLAYAFASSSDLNLVSGGIEQKMADFGKEEADFGRFGHNPA
jgi:hypothetical protein